MDGTMIDNMMVHHRAWQRKLADLGFDWSIERVMDEIHGVNIEILERIFGDRFTLEERVQISNEKEAAYRQIYQSEIKPIDGLIDFLESVKVANIPMAIGTAAPAENAEFVLEYLPISGYFDAIFHAGDVTKGKPDPQVFELAAAAMDVPLTDCLIFEDSLTGAEAAKRGGAAAVIVTTTHRREEFAAYDHILRFITDYKGLKLEDLRSI